MEVVETGIPVITTPTYDNAWECLEGHEEIIPHKRKFDVKFFPEGIPARSGCIATRYKLLRDLSFLTMASVILGEESCDHEQLWRDLITRDKVFSLKQVLHIVSKRLNPPRRIRRREDYGANNFFFVEAREDRPCVVAAEANFNGTVFILRTFSWIGGMPFGNYGNLFIPSS